MPHAASTNPFITATSGAAPRRTTGANSIVWFINISRGWDREPASQSMSLLLWWAS